MCEYEWSYVTFLGRRNESGSPKAYITLGEHFRLSALGSLGPSRVWCLMERLNELKGIIEFVVFRNKMA